ncbi:MAG: RDD family protein, partial [Halomonas sp.]
MRTRRFTQLGDAWPAGLGRRLGAMLYDGFLVTAIWIAVTVVHLMFFRYMLGQSPEDIGATACDVWSLRIMLVVFVSLFFVFSWTRGGMTLGMQAWRLRVQTREGY